MKTCKVLFSALALLLASAWAAAAQSYYLGAYGGAGIAHDSDTSNSGVPGVSITVSSNIGYALGGFAGYEFGNGFRVEGELAYRRNSLDEQSALGTTFQMQGDAATLALMANGIYEFQTGGSAFSPYIGAGIGMARFSLIDAGVVGSTPEDNDDTVLAYQLIAGIGYELSPTLTLFADYRLFGMANPEFTDSSGNAVKTEYLGSTVLIGLSRSF